MRKHKILGILLGTFLLIMGSAACAALPPRISWTPAQLAPASMAPGTSASHTVVLKHTGILPIPFTNQLRIVAEGAIAPFVTITQPKFPALLKRGNQVTFQVTVSAIIFRVARAIETGIARELRNVQTPKFNGLEYRLNMALRDEQGGRKGMKNNLK